MSARVWLVGEHNPVSADPRHALYPHPPNCAGARLCRALGLEPHEYLRRFERRNLLDTARWSAPRARSAANALLGEVLDGDRLVLLGARVASAFGWRFVPLSEHDGVVPDTKASYRVLVVPHPSGLSRAWNDKTMAPRVRAAVELLAKETRA